MSPTVPLWINAVFYLFMMVSFTIAVRGIIKKQLVLPSLISVILIPLSSFILVLASIGRGNQNELAYFIDSVKSIDIWAWLCLAMFVYLFYWWYLVLRYHKQT